MASLACKTYASEPLEPPPHRAASATSAYSPLGEESSRTTTLYFHWASSTTLAEETDGAGTTIATYLPDGDGGVVGQRREGQLSWMLDDPAGNVATRVDAAGSVLEQSAFDPYGRP